VSGATHMLGVGVDVTGFISATWRLHQAAHAPTPCGHGGLKRHSHWSQLAAVIPRAAVSLHARLLLEIES